MLFTTRLHRWISAHRARSFQAMRRMRSQAVLRRLEDLETRTLLSIGLASTPAQVSLLQTGVTAHPEMVNQTSTTTDAQTQSKTLNDLPALEKYAISSSIGADQPQYLATAIAGGYTLANRTNSYTTSLSTGGVSLSAGSDTWSLDLESFGRGNTQTVVSPSAPQAQGNKVTYSHGSISDWYVNGPLGLQQGFTVSNRPAGATSEPLKVTVALGGSLKASLDTNAQGLNLTRADGSTALTYGGQVAYDATGKTLDASLALVPQGTQQDLVFQVNDANAVYPVTIDPVVQTAKLTASDGAANAHLGASLALSADGNTALIGAPGAIIGGNVYAGAAYIFTQPTGGWASSSTFTAKLTPYDSTEYLYFGVSVALSGDGNTALVGAYQATIGSNSAQGAAYLYTKPNGGWGSTSYVTAKLTAADGQTNSDLGVSVALSSNGSTALVGALRDTINGNANQGSAYIFTEPNGGWSSTSNYTAKLTAADGTAGVYFGDAVSLSGDGNTALIGATQANVGSHAKQGAAYVYAKPTGGWATTSNFTAKLTAADGAASDQLGQSVALSADGSTALLGAYNATVGSNTGQGAAYIYGKPATGWATTGVYNARLTTSEGVANDYFGYSVALSADGSTALVGAYLQNAGQGAAYTYYEPFSGWATTNTYTSKLTAADGAAGAYYGDAVAVNGDGSTGLVGAYYATIGSNGGQGAAYTYSLRTRTNTTLTTSASTAVYGQPVTFTATVTAATGTPTGAVQFQVDGVNYGSPVNLVNGVASGTIATLSPGSHTFSAAFTSDSLATANSASARSNIIFTVAGGGVGDGNPATNVNVAFPGAVAVDSNGNVFIAEYCRIREVFKDTGAIVTVAGNGVYGFSGDGGAATDANVASLSGVSVDSAGNLFIADYSNNRIREVIKATGVIITVAGGSYGFSGDGGAATDTSLGNISGLAVDSAGNLFIADYSAHRIREVIKATGVIITVAGNGSYGFSGDGGAATDTSLGNIYGLAVDSAGNVFISDGNRVREVIKATGVIITVAGNGTEGFGGDGGTATNASMTYPTGMAVDSAGNLFIADQGNQRIREVIKATGVITTVAGNGATGFSGDGGAATDASISYPRGVALDTVGNLFIADSNNNRIREVIKAVMVQREMDKPGVVR